jgi:hypothetical protein
MLLSFLIGNIVNVAVNPTNGIVMSTQQIQQAASQAGFSRTASAANKYILFDDDTDGRCGRCVFIDQGLLAKFQGSTDGKVEELKYVFHRIKQLKSRAGDLASHFDPQDPKSKISMFGKAEIKYTIHQPSASSGMVAGVYIDDLNLASFSGAEPGLYNVKDKNGEFVLSNKRVDSIPTTRAAINGLCESAKQAAELILPPMVNVAYGHRKWDKLAGTMAPDDSYTMFYNPPDMYKNGKRMVSQGKATNQRLTADRLAEALKEAQSRNKKVQWVVHGDGIYALESALKKVSGKSLDCHTAIFLSPNSDVSKILPLMNRSGMKIHDTVYQTHDDDLISRDAQSGNGRRLKNALVEMGHDNNAAAVMKTDANNNVWKKAAMLTASAGTGFGLGTLMLNPVISIPLVTVGGVAAGAIALKGNVDAAKSVKNNVAARMGVTEPALNPHLNPFASKTDMNQKATDFRRAQGKSFVSRVLGRG